MGLRSRQCQQNEEVGDNPPTSFRKARVLALLEPKHCGDGEIGLGHTVAFTNQQSRARHADSAALYDDGRKDVHP
jgi:hypothetical protein